MEDKLIELEVPKSLEGERVDRAIALLLDCSRSVVSQFIESQKVLLNSVAVKSSSKRLKAGDQLKFAGFVEAKKAPSADANVNFDVVYEDNDLLIVDKPAGLVVHPAPGNWSNTLVNGLLHRYPEIAGIGDDPRRPGIVHRLDKGTSGIMLVARSNIAHQRLSEMLKMREIERIYLGVCWGRLENPKGIIDAPLKRTGMKRKQTILSSAGKDARTHYKKKAELKKGATLFEATLETGRTHQIRIHFSAIGHPLAGDELYGGKMPSDFSFERVALHSTQLAFMHPISQEPLRAEKSPPKEFSDLVQYLDKN